jgi:hypothetical protein
MRRITASLSSVFRLNLHGQKQNGAIQLSIYDVIFEFSQAIEPDKNDVAGEIIQPKAKVLSIWRIAHTKANAKTGKITN